MKSPDALQALAALSHATRLEVFRLLVGQGALGLPAGQIAARLQVAPSTLSPHLAQLERAGLATSWRDERRILYAVNIAGMRALLTYPDRGMLRRPSRDLRLRTTRGRP